MKILIVGFDTEITALMGKLLRRKGYDVVCSTNVEQTPVLIERENIGLVIADIDTDEVMCIKFCKTVKSIKKPPKLLFIGNSGDEESRMLNAGADDWLKKPYKTAVFLARISALLRRSLTE